MNSKERLNTVLNGQLPDRVPVSTYELAGYNTESFENKDASYSKLMDHIRKNSDCIAMWDLKGDPHIFETCYPVQINSQQSREGDAAITKKIVHTPKGQLQQTAKVIDNINTVWQTEHWCKTSEDVDKALSVPYVPIQWDGADFERIENEVGDKGIIMASLADPLCVAAELMDFGGYTVWALTETDHFVKTLDILHERIMENLRRMLDVCVVDLYRICGAEYATPPYLPPRLFEKFVVPYVTDMTELIHSKGAKVRLHSHGKIARVLDMITATGVDAIDPCEGPPDGDIELSDVKKQIGGTICIFGNIQLKLLEGGSADDIITEVKKCMDAAKAGGKFVIMPTAAPINIPLSKRTEENYITFIDAALKYGQY